MVDFNDKDLQYKFKQGLAANINSTATLNSATRGEPHYTIDTKKLYIFDGTAMVEVGASAFNPPSMADSAAANNSVYFSTTANKLVYKDSSGTVNNLY